MILALLGGAWLNGPRQDFDDDHLPSAARASAPCFRDGFAFDGIPDRWLRHGQKLAGAGDIVLAGGTGELPVMANAANAPWRDMQQKAADELYRFKRHGADSARHHRGDNPWSGR
jgi:hypothetical protein